MTMTFLHARAHVNINSKSHDQRDRWLREFSHNSYVVEYGARIQLAAKRGRCVGLIYWATAR